MPQTPSVVAEGNHIGQGNYTLVFLSTIAGDYEFDVQVGVHSRSFATHPPNGECGDRLMGWIYAVLQSSTRCNCCRVPSPPPVQQRPDQALRMLETLTLRRFSPCRSVIGLIKTNEFVVALALLLMRLLLSLQARDEFGNEVTTASAVVTAQLKHSSDTTSSPLDAATEVSPGRYQVRA